MLLWSVIYLFFVKTKTPELVRDSKEMMGDDEMMKIVLRGKNQEFSDKNV